MFYPNKSSILVSGEGNSSRSKMNSFMRILNLQRIVFLMCIVSSGEITWGTKDNKARLKEKIKVEKLGNVNLVEPNFEYKVIFLGDTNVGKTQILNKYNDGSFYNHYLSTVRIYDTEIYYSCEFKQHPLEKETKLKIYDIPGQEKNKPLSQECLQNAQTIVFVYDITKKDSFDNIGDWLDSTAVHAPKDAVYFLVGNKTDLNDERQVQTEEAKKYAGDKNMQFFEVSVNDNNSIDKLFEDIVKECLIKNLNLNYNVIAQEPGEPIITLNPIQITEIREEINHTKEKISEENKNINDKNNTEQNLNNITTANNTTKESTCRNCCSCCCNC
ncbi:MAG: GTP-binding protein [Cytophagales bacterium]|nr:GTP-binding protein [Cytophagales bacterium]